MSKTFGQLTEVQALEANAVIPVNNASDTISTKITFENLKTQIINDIPDSMIFKGTVGENGTLEVLPEAISYGSSKNTGFTYKVITDGIYWGNPAKVGDLLISDGENWILIPSGNEADGTVTSVNLTEGTGINVSGGPITTSGSITVSHAATSDQPSVTNNGRYYIQSILLDEMGHVTGLSSAEETVTDTHYNSSIIVGDSDTATSDAVAGNGDVTINHIENDIITNSHKIIGSGSNTVTSDEFGNIIIKGANINTHYNSSIAVTSSANDTENDASISGTVYINHVENEAVTDSHKITGSGSTIVTSDEYGNINIDGNNTDTHYASGIVVSNTDSSTTNDIATNGNVMINHVENEIVTDSHKITGAGSTIVTSDVNGNITITSSDTVFDVSTLGTASLKNYTDTYDSNGDDLTTGKAVAAALASLPEPMVFKGSLGIDGTILELPEASSSGVSKNTGFTYKVITDGTYANIAAKVGDTFISTGHQWVLIPSGDEPSGTVTSIKLTEGTGINVSGGPITTSGAITVSHADTSEQESTSNSGRTYIQNITLDEMGHVTGLSSAQETVTDTHYNSSIVISNLSSAKTNGAGDNGSVYINHIENDTVTDYHTITGFGTISVTSDESGNISIAGADTYYSSSIAISDSIASTDGAADNGNVIINHIQNGEVTDSHGIIGSGTVTVTSDENGNLTVEGTDTNTHYTSSIAINDSISDNNGAADNGNVHLNHIENDEITDYHTIIGSGTVEVTSDENGNITIDGADTNTHYTSSIVVGSTDHETEDGEADNGEVHVIHIENDEITDYHTIIGSGSTTVTSDESGNITVNGDIAFNKVKVDESTLTSGENKDTIELIARDNISITANEFNNTVSISAVDTTYESKEAASEGEDISLVTTGEKYLWNNKQDSLTFDDTPTANSTNPITSGAVYSYIDTMIAQAITDLY